MPLHTGSAAIAGDNAGAIAEINENTNVTIAIRRQAAADRERIEWDFLVEWFVLNMFMHPPHWLRSKVNDANVATFQR